MKITSDEVKDILDLMGELLERPFKTLRDSDIAEVVNKLNSTPEGKRWGGIAYQGLKLNLDPSLPDACVFTPEIKAELDAIQDRYYSHVTSPIAWAKSIVSAAIARSFCPSDLFKLVPPDICEILKSIIRLPDDEPSSLTQRDIMAFQESCKEPMQRYRQLQMYRALGVY